MAGALVDVGIYSILVKYPRIHRWIKYCVERGIDRGAYLWPNRFTGIGELPAQQVNLGPGCILRSR